MNTEIAHIKESEYNSILLQAVAVIDEARGKLAKHVSTIVSTTHWNIGKLLYEKKLESKYGSGVVERLSVDLKQRYPKLGLSPRQLWNMKRFYVRYAESNEKLLRTVAVLPWSHNLLILSKNLDDAATLYYAQEVMEKGWNRDLLLNAIKMQMHKSQPQLPIDSNFKKALSTPQATYANEVFRSQYNLGFLGVTEPLAELELGGKTSKVDLLFFHRGLHALVAIDLKIGEFKPEYAGKMNYYLSLLDRLERRDDENRSIGIILCAEKDHLEVELALEGMSKPIGVADYQLLIPKEELQKVVTDEIEIYERDKKE